ncbi:MAG: CRISPR-associated protein Cas4 [Candidatus Sedimenticola sp. (ex Thyasira tokunagai)]
MDTFKDDDLLPISALQHYAYCPRQFALIHLEQIWEENRFTAEGQLLHQRVNSGETETRGDLHIARTLRLRSTRLGLTGIADVVEFYRTERGGVKLHGCSGAWQPLPVEYKRGRSKTDDWDRLQLCAQAFCLEEVFETTIQEGAIFYGKPRRREQVSFDAELRSKTQLLCSQMHTLWGARNTPMADPSAKCDHCSLQQRCLPVHGQAKAYLHRVLDL